MRNSELKNIKKSKNKKPFVSRAMFFLTYTMEKFEQLAPVKKIISKNKASIKARCGSDEGYAEYALKLNFLKIFLIVCLIIAILLGVMFSAGRMDIDNLYYMAKDIGYMNSYAETQANVLNYSQTDTACDYALYKKGLAVACNSEIKLFNATGRVTLTSGDVFANPVIVTSNKYMIVYDLGGTKLSVYNSFKKLTTINFDGQIANVATSSDGGFSVAVKSDDYNSVIHRYSNKLEEISTYSTNKYVVSVTSSKNCKYTAVVGISIDGGSTTTQITVLKKNKGKVYSQFDIGEVTPYTCAILDENRIAVICSDCVRTYSLKGKLKGEYRYDGNQIANLSYTENIVSLMFQDDLVNGQNTLVVLNKNAKIIYNGKIRGNFTDMQAFGDYVFLLTNDGISKFNYKTKITVSKSSDDTFGKILVCNKNRVLLCTESRGIYFDIE